MVSDPSGEGGFTLCFALSRACLCDVPPHKSWERALLGGKPTGEVEGTDGDLLAEIFVALY